MERILVIEDEPLEMAALCGNIKKIYGDRISVLRAEDGNEALEICLEETPDVAVVDINIPGISGLELIDILTRRHFAGKVIILTAYDTSDYIRQALRLGVLDYLLKPVPITALKAALDKCFSALDSDRQQKKEHRIQTALSSYTDGNLLRDMMNGAPPEELLATAYGWPDDGNLFAFLLDAKEKGTLNQSLRSGLWPSVRLIAGAKNDRFLAVLQSERGTEAEDTSLLPIFLQCLLLHDGAEDVLAFGPLFSYGELARAFSGEGKKFSPLYHSLGNLEEIKKLLHKWETRLRERNAGSFVRMFKRRILMEGCYWEQVSLFLEALSSFAGQDARKSIDFIRLFQIFRGDRPYARLQEWLAALFSRMEEEPQNPSDAIAFVLAWMETHYMEDLSRQEAASLAGLSESYFSNQFTQKTGSTFINSLNEIRIRHARELMRDGNRNFQDIAKACGFYSHRYFFDVFRKYTGQSVTEYLRGIEDGGNS